jgi:hypothetical protein
LMLLFMTFEVIVVSESLQVENENIQSHVIKRGNFPDR